MTKESVKPKQNETYDEYIERLVVASLAGKKISPKEAEKILGFNVEDVRKND